MMDLRNRDLTKSMRADEFIISDQLDSLIMTQVAENPALNRILNDLLGAQGAEIFLKPATDYVRRRVPVSFYTVVASARRCGKVTIGYPLQA